MYWTHSYLKRKEKKKQQKEKLLRVTRCNEGNDYDEDDDVEEENCNGYKREQREW